MYGISMASKIKLSPTQIKDIYEILPPICAEFNISEPSLYLEMNPFPNAYTFGDTMVAITLTSGLLEYLNKDEIKAVLAHECAHIACRHVLYNTMANFLSSGIGSLGAWASIPIKLGLLYWSRRAELSCDRAAAILTNGPKQIINVMIRLAGGPKDITNAINVIEFANQAINYDKLLESKWDKLLQSYAAMGNDHPFIAVRVHEILKWTNDDSFKRILKNKEIQSNELRCNNCGSEISPTWVYCKNCGSRIK